MMERPTGASAWNRQGQRHPLDLGDPVPLSYPTLPGDLNHMIENDFMLVKRESQHLEADRGNRRVLVDHIAFEMSLHGFAVEQVLYPVVEETSQIRDLEQARERNNGAKELLVTLLKTDSDQPEFDSPVAELIAGFREQHAGSDAESLPALRENIGAQRLAELGKQFLAAKHQAPTAPHPHAPDHGVAEKIAGALAKPLDNVKAKFMGIKPTLATDASGLLHPQAQAIVDAHSARPYGQPLKSATCEVLRQGLCSDRIGRVEMDNQHWRRPQPHQRRKRRHAGADGEFGGRDRVDDPQVAAARKRQADGLPHQPYRRADLLQAARDIQLDTGTIRRRHDPPSISVQDRQRYASGNHELAGRAAVPSLRR
jgi:hypothetical protein